MDRGPNISDRELKESWAAPPVLDASVSKTFSPRTNENHSRVGSLDFETPHVRVRIRILPSHMLVSSSMKRREVNWASREEQSRKY